MSEREGRGGEGGMHEGKYRSDSETQQRNTRIIQYVMF